jgi:selenocysteine lyase/cysteine desulfurase
VLGLAERGGLLRTGVSMYSSAAEIRRLLDAIERLG